MNQLRKFFRLWPRFRSLFYKYYNRFWFKVIGIEYGKRMVVEDKIYVLGRGKIIIGDDFTFTSGNCHNPICRNIRGALYPIFSESEIIIGNCVGISSACLWAKERITIGNNVNIGGDCLLLDSDAHPHHYIDRRRDFEDKLEFDTYQKKILSAPIVIEDDVWIGARCIILKGVHIGARSIIAAGSVVTKDIPTNCVAGGNPCTIIRKIENIDNPESKNRFHNAI